MGRCIRCKGVEGGDYAYVGETHRSIVSRSRSHYSLYRPGNIEPTESQNQCEEGPDDFKCGSWMKAHTIEKHGGVFSDNKQDDYEFIPLGTHRKPLSRQVEESLLIRKGETKGEVRVGKKVYRVQKTLLNSKAEYYSPRAIVLVGG